MRILLTGASGFIGQPLASRGQIRAIRSSRPVVAEKGAPQGAVISPLLSNIYLHYVFDLWAHHWRRHQAVGDVILIRYADDSVMGFEHEREAIGFLAAMRERFALFGLKLHPEKTRLIEFGKWAAVSRQRRGLGKPESFDFLGFTHCCGATREGRFKIVRFDQEAHDRDVEGYPRPHQEAHA